METQEERVRRVVAEQVDVEPYNPAWPTWFEEEKAILFEKLPEGLLVRIEHFGSTAVPDLAAKPIVDVLVEVSDVEAAKELLPRVFTPPGYDYFWRPSWGDDVPPWYSFLIKRNAEGRRTHHIHVGEPGLKDDELRFCQVLLNQPEVAEAYGKLKIDLAKKHQQDRIAYTEAKGDFIRRVMMS